MEFKNYEDLVADVTKRIEKDSMAVAATFEMNKELQRQKNEGAVRVAEINQETARIETSGRIKAAVITAVAGLLGFGLNIGYNEYRYRRAEREEAEGLSVFNIDNKTKPKIKRF